MPFISHPLQNQIKKLINFIYIFINLIFQVSNWFINARVRLWKPMVEEIYKEEAKEEEEVEETRTDEAAANESKSSSSSSDKDHLNKTQNMVISAAAIDDDHHHHQGKKRSEINAIEENDLSKNIINYGQYSLGNEAIFVQGNNTTILIPTTTAHHHHQYGINYMATTSNNRQGGGGGGDNVSLTLGLQHSDNILPRKRDFSILRNFGVYRNDAY